MSEPLAAAHVIQLREFLSEQTDAQTLQRIEATPGFAAVTQASEFVTRQCQRSPAALIELIDQELLVQPYAGGQLRGLLSQQLAEVNDETSLARVLRQFRNQQMLRIIWRDIGGLAGLNETLEDLSELADACIDATVGHLYEWATAKSGTPRNADGEAQELVVIGMGKLGARELNLSSDIDLIFAYPERGQTDGRRQLDNEQFFTRLARQVIKAIGENTVDGFVFRVDTRLRPFGDAGPLVIPLGFFEDYLHGQAREWERYAMVKARVISGSEAAIESFQALVSPFVYRRYLDFSAIESIRDMKKLINNEMHRRGMDANIKLGRGGIREIEFIGQAFQLIRGGREPQLQIRPIQQVLDRLAQMDMLPQHEVDELQAAYQFLRLTENRLQAWKDEQTHVLPGEDDADARQRLAVSMTYSDWDSFSEALQAHRNRVHGYFELLFAAPQAESTDGNRFDQLWQEEVDEDAASHLLDLAGFTDPGLAWRQLQAFRQSSACRFLGENGRRRLDQLMPMLLEAVAAAEHSNLLLERLLPFLESIARRTVYIALMVENPLVLSQLVRLMAESEWIARQITQHPLLLDELLDPRRLYTPLKRTALQEELAASMAAVEGDEEQSMERLRHFAQACTLRVAAADVTHVIPVEVVSDYLTEIAEVVTDEVFESAFSRLAERHGRPQQTAGPETGFAVIAYGKLGGFELGYSSDLDLVFLHDSQKATAMTDGDKQVANDVFFARLGQRMIHQFATRTPSGTLYDVDMRLRPNGNSGLLVSSLVAFEKYQLEEAWTWEHQALVRARAITGDPVTMASFEAVRRRVLSQRRDVPALQAEVRQMREKMRVSLDKSDAEHFDLKQGVGGIADIEFMVQYAVLRWACDYPDLMDWTDNARLLDVLAKHALLPGDWAQSLLKAYRSYRATYHHRSLQQEQGVIDRSRFAEQHSIVSQAWQQLMLEAV